MSSKPVQNTPMSGELRRLHGALIDIVGAFNRPQNDRAMIREAGISLDRALFPLLVAIERRGPIGVVELADRVGRDHTTVSRQVATLERMGLVARRAAGGDRRIRAAVVTSKGKKMTDAIDAARERLAGRVLEGWSQRDLRMLVRLLRRFADDLSKRSAP